MQEITELKVATQIEVAKLKKDRDIKIFEIIKQKYFKNIKDIESNRDMGLITFNEYICQTLDEATRAKRRIDANNINEVNLFF